MYESSESLYKLFTQTKIVESIEIQPSKLTINQVSRNELTPFSQLIYDSVSTNEKKKLLEDFKKDDMKIDLEDINDPDYIEKLENNKLGFYMEDFICHHFICPICQQKTLRKFSINNMPVVDLICVNYDYHYKYKKTFLFQIKISVDNTTYFSNKNRYILVGSKKYGYNSHEISANDNINKKFILINYICLYLNQKSDHTYQIDKKNSFILIPDLSKNNRELYYKYLEGSYYFNRNKITWNPNLVNIKDINNYCDKYMVDTNTIFDITAIINNPYNEKINRVTKKLQFAGYYYKYKKYKAKYLNKIKENINK